MTFRTLRPGQRSQILIGSPTASAATVLVETREMLVEAPNWSRDGRTLYLNGNGRLWSLDVAAPETGLQAVDHTDLPELNNDHVLDPDGEHIYLSAMDGHIYHAALSGGPAVRVTPHDDRWHFLHGVSPDGRRLAYVEIETFAQPGRLAVLNLRGGPPRILPTGPGHIDGPEWSADGAWLYFNTEGFTVDAGHAQLARIADAGSPVERLLDSPTVDWFPHLSPDGTLATYVSFPAGTLGHPADLDVTVTVVGTGDWATPLQRYSVFGGQGTLNVNSWAPDNSRFAFVAYPVD